MKRLYFLLCLLVTPFPAFAEPASPELKTELRRMTQELLDAIAPGNKAVWELYLHPNFLILDENGAVHSKSELIAELEPLPPGLNGNIQVDGLRVEVTGDTAVAVVDLQERLDYHGQPLHTRFRTLDTWQRSSEGWRLIGQHVAAVLRDPPGVALGRAELCAYAGLYRLTDAIETRIECDDEGLVARRAGRPVVRYQAELRDLFFATGQPRTRRIFLRDGAGRITGFADRREGEDIVWRRAD